MNGCIYRTKHGQCVLYSDEGQYNALCDMENCEGRRKSNADRIREMTDEELSHLLGWPCVAFPPWCSINTKCPYMQSEDVSPCDKCALDWLRQEAENDRA